MRPGTFLTVVYLTFVVASIFPTAFQAHGAPASNPFLSAAVSGRMHFNPTQTDPLHDQEPGL